MVRRAKKIHDGLRWEKKKLEIFSSPISNHHVGIPEVRRFLTNFSKVGDGS
jgi:hypothetical protein